MNKFVHIVLSDAFSRSVVRGLMPYMALCLVLLTAGRA
jgi:hypothetical protein